MTVARTVADVLADHVVFEVECIDRMYCNVYVPQLQYAGGLLGYIQRQFGLPIASTAPLGKITDAFSGGMRHFAGDQRVPWVDFTKGQRKDDVMQEHLARFTAPGGGPVHRAGAGEDRAVPHREPPRRQRRLVSLDREDHGRGQPVLLLCRRRRLRPVLPQVLHLLSLQRQAVHQRPRVGQAATGQGRDRLRGAGQRRSPPAPTRRGAGNLRRPGPDADRRAAAQVAGAAAASVHRRGPRGRLPLRRVDPPGRVLPDPGPGPAALGPGLLRRGHPREPRHRPPRPGQPDLRPALRRAGRAHRAGSAPG